MADEMVQHYDEWSSCQMYGHVYEEDEENPSKHICRDCGEEYED